MLGKGGDKRASDIETALQGTPRRTFPVESIEYAIKNLATWPTSRWPSTKARLALIFDVGPVVPPSSCSSLPVLTSKIATICSERGPLMQPAATRPKGRLIREKQNASRSSNSRNKAPAARSHTCSGDLPWKPTRTVSESRGTKTPGFSLPVLIDRGGLLASWVS